MTAYRVTALPPLMSLPMFFKAFNISKSLFYKLPPEARPRTVRVGSKLMVRAEDAIAWVESLSEVEQ